MRPLHVLVFLAPLILFYEIAAAVHVMQGAGGAEETIRARKILEYFFRMFDIGGLYLPGILVCVVLLTWHILIRDPWRIRGRVLGWMAVESLVWTPPVLVLGQVLYRLLSGTAGGPPEAVSMIGAVANEFAARPLTARAAIAVGAGLYEEMLFRMVLIAILHAVLVDLMGLKERRGTVLSVLMAAVAFAFYHDLTLKTGGIDWASAAFYTFIGLYMGVIYVLRGFGIVVAVHAAYDLAVLLFLRGNQA